MHVTLKLRGGLPSLRRRRAHAVLCAAFASMRVREDFRIVQFSVQSNHVHLLCEARDRRELARAIQSLAIRIAKRLNALWERAGQLFADRYHDRILRTPREVRNAFGHGLRLVRGEPDPFSSGRWFDGWHGRVHAFAHSPNPLSRARTWLLSTGWSHHGPIALAVAR